KGQVPAQNHTFTIDASKLQSGIYFYTVTAGTSQVTRKMIVE
ncbi:MAG: T9SS type A sorting domain-containing protein, partial [Bacteroidales bacterium]|nr:T9SS type A sorting domain-containing protein [Bacteroidales bacterium]